MNASEHGVNPMLPPYHGAKAVAAFFIFVIAGPPLGFLMLLIIGVILSPSQFSVPLRINLNQLGMIFHGIVLFSALSYIIGGVQAAVVGVVAAVSRYVNRRERVPLSWIVLASATVCIGFLAIMFLRARQPWQQQPSFSAGALVGWMAVHLGAGIGCWALTNLMFRPSRQPAAGSE